MALALPLLPSPPPKNVPAALERTLSGGPPAGGGGGGGCGSGGAAAAGGSGCVGCGGGYGGGHSRPGLGGDMPGIVLTHEEAAAEVDSFFENLMDSVGAPSDLDDVALDVISVGGGSSVDGMESYGSLISSHEVINSMDLPVAAVLPAAPPSPSSNANFEIHDTILPAFSVDVMRDVGTPASSSLGANGDISFATTTTTARAAESPVDTSKDTPQHQHDTHSEEAREKYVVKPPPGWSGDFNAPLVPPPQHGLGTMEPGLPTKELLPLYGPHLHCTSPAHPYYRKNATYARAFRLHRMRTKRLNAKYGRTAKVNTFQYRSEIANGRKRVSGRFHKSAVDFVSVKDL